MIVRKQILLVKGSRNHKIRFANKQNLKKYVEAVHEGIKHFKCCVCDVEFASSYNP